MYTYVTAWYDKIAEISIELIILNPIFLLIAIEIARFVS